MTLSMCLRTYESTNVCPTHHHRCHSSASCMAVVLTTVESPTQTITVPLHSPPFSIVCPARVDDPSPAIPDQAHDGPQHPSYSTPLDSFSPGGHRITRLRLVWFLILSSRCHDITHRVSAFSSKTPNIPGLSHP
jgi:hypothetical protein